MPLPDNIRADLKKRTRAIFKPDKVDDTPAYKARRRITKMFTEALDSLAVEDISFATQALNNFFIGMMFLEQSMNMESVAIQPPYIKPAATQP